MNDTNKGTRFCITTTDNPYNPFTQFPEWDAYDREKAEHTHQTCTEVKLPALTLENPQLWSCDSPQLYRDRKSVV